MANARKDSSRLFISESFLVSLVIFVAFALRISHVIFTAKLNPLASDLVLDAAIYDRWAKALVWGGNTGPTSLMQAPLYPWFVSAVYRIFGPGLTAVRAVQALLGTLTCGFMMASTRRLFRSSTAGILAGVIFALYLPAIFYEGVLAPPTLILFLNALFIFLMIPESRYPAGPRLLLAGFILGLSVVAKPVALLMLPFAIMHLLLRIRKFEGGRLADRKREWAASLKTLSVNTVILGFGLLIAITPLTIRNARLTGEFIPLTTGGGINFYIGNNPESTGFYSVPFFRGMSLGGTPEEQYRKMHEIASSEAGRPLSHLQVSNFWMTEGIESSLEDKGKWLGLLWKKSIFFWNRYERANIENIDFHKRFGGILALPLLNFGIVAPLGLLGIFSSFGRRKRLMLLYGGVMTYFAAALLFYVLARYRLPVVVFLVPFAGAGAAGILKLLADRQWIRGVLLITAFLLMAKLVNTTVAEDTPYGKSQNLVRLGRIYSRQGDRENAKSSFEEALKLYPQNEHALKGLELLGFPPGDR